MNIYETQALEVCWLVLVSGGFYYRIVPTRVKAVVVDGQSSQTGMEIVTSLVWTNSHKCPS